MFVCNCSSMVNRIDVRQHLALKLIGIYVYKYIIFIKHIFQKGKTIIRKKFFNLPERKLYVNFFFKLY